MTLFHSLQLKTTGKRTMVIVACLLLAACGSGGSSGSGGDSDLGADTGTDSSANDPSTEPLIPAEEPTSTPAGTQGRLDDIDGEAHLGFSIAEDTILNGIFVNPSAEQGRADVPTDVGPETGFSQFTILSLPTFGFLQLSPDGTSFSYEPNANYFGDDVFSYVTSTGREVAIDINISPEPDAPTINRDITPIANQGRRYQVQLQGFDADGDALTFAAENLPDWLVLDTDSGILTGVPGQADVGVVEGIRLSVVDSTGLRDVIQELPLEVVDINDVPILNLTQAPRELFGRQLTNFNVFPRDIENDFVEVFVEPNELLTTSVNGGQINIEVADVENAQTTDLTIVARDDRGAATRESISIALFPRTESNKGTTLLGHKQGRGVHIVILGDGYSSDELPTYRRHVDSVLANIQSDTGIAEHVGALNIHMIEIVSQQSGADDSDTDDRVTTAFDSAYNCRAIPRLICADILKLFEASLAEYPDVDQIILLVNDSRYGGSGNSGGRVAITSAFFPEIALHEMGHSLADLADEYVDPLILDVTGILPFEEGRFANVSNLSDPAQVPWAHWLDLQNSLPPSAGDLGVGVFEGGYYRSTGVYRSSVSNRMRDYNSHFGPVNTEQWILRLYTLTEGIRSLSPEELLLEAITGDILSFNVEPIFGDVVQRIVWALNGQVLNFHDNAPNSGALSVVANDNLHSLNLSLPPGQHQLSVTISDVSGRIQIPPPHAGIFTRQWDINVL